MEVTTRNTLHDHLMHGNDKRKSSRKRKNYTEPQDDFENDISSPPPVKKQKRKTKKRSYNKDKPSTGSTKGGRWTYDEKKMFLKGIRVFGRGKWSSIAKDIPTRTVVQVKTHAQSLFKRYKEGQDLEEFVKEELEFIDKEIGIQDKESRKQDKVPLTPTRRETQSIVSNDEVKEEETTPVPKQETQKTKKNTSKQRTSQKKDSTPKEHKEDVPMETIHIPASLELDHSMDVFDNIEVDHAQNTDVPPTPTLPRNFQHLAYPTEANYDQPPLLSPMLFRHMPPTPASYYQKLNLYGDPNAKVDAKMFDETFTEEQGYDMEGQHVQAVQAVQDVHVDMEQVNQSFHLWMQQEHGADIDIPKDTKVDLEVANLETLYMNMQNAKQTWPETLLLPMQNNKQTWPETLLPMQNTKQIQSLQNEVIPMKVQLEPQLAIPMEVQCEPQLPFSFIGGSSNLASCSPLRMALKLSPRRRLSPRKLSPQKQPNLPLPFFSSPPPMNSDSAAVPVATPSVATPGHMATPPSAASTYLMNTFSKGKGMAQKDLKEIKSRKVSMEHGLPTTLATPEDFTKGNLNSLHQYVRSELLEICLASEKEICGKQTLHEKRVGFQCVHCAKSSNGDMPGNSRFFPKSLEQIYRGVCTWQRIHFLNCKHTPDVVKQYYTHLKTSDKARGRTAYWVEAAKAIGLKDNDTKQGIIFS